jgi:hypothetical protein
MKIFKSSDWFVNENKRGNNKFWRLHILQDGTEYFTQTEWYQISAAGKETKRQVSTPYFAAPTNEGRANARDSYEQSLFEYDAIIKKQRDAGYHLDGETITTYPLPMLAHKFRDHTQKVDWPVYVQPKLNGMRMLFNGRIGWSRGNKEVIPEVIQHLQCDTSGFILDGELMLPGNLLLQESMKAIKKFRPELSPTLIYHVYDIVAPELPYEARWAILQDLVPLLPGNIQLVKTVRVDDETQVFHLHNLFVGDGYEGTMVRDPVMTYEIGKRSYSLLKLKDFQDAEYRILDVIDGAGSDEGLAIFVLDAGNGQTFNCRPEGTQENRAELYESRDMLRGKHLTVRYFELSKDNIPIFPVGVSVRDNGEF